MSTWVMVQDAVILLSAATLLGTLFDRLRQDAVLGYLLAGALLGPHAFNVVPDREAILAIADLGLALLLFAIGMEFSWRKLRRLGPIALGGGTLQVLVTIGAGTIVGQALGLDLRQAVAIGAMVALSSTALVIRLLAERAELESFHGRNAVGILLLQDVAVVPLVLVVGALAGGSSTAALGWEIVRALMVGLLLVGAIFVLLRYVFPRFAYLSMKGTNRDLPALLAVVTALGCAWAAHSLHLSPLLGAFAGGVVLAESPFGSQVRADLSPLKAVFVTLFFAAIGTLTNPLLVVEQLGTVTALTAGIVLGKAAIVFAIALAFRSPVGAAAATALCLAQIGEFSFVLLEITRDSQLITLEFFELMVTVVVATLFLTPYLVALARRVARLTPRAGGAVENVEESTARSVRVVLVGFGPAGQAVAKTLADEEISFRLVEWNHSLAAEAEARGFDVVIGDATRIDVLERACVGGAEAIAITVPDPTVAQQITAQSHGLAVASTIATRGRYQRHIEDLYSSGATTVADEETLVGLEVAAEIKRALGVTDP